MLTVLIIYFYTNQYCFNEHILTAQGPHSMNCTYSAAAALIFRLLTN